MLVLLNVWCQYTKIKDKWKLRKQFESFNKLLGVNSDVKPFIENLHIDTIISPSNL